MHYLIIANNDMDLRGKENKVKEDSSDKNVKFSENDDYLKNCPNGVNQDEIPICSRLQYPCIVCNRSIQCIYGESDNYTCYVKAKVLCNVSKFNKPTVKIIINL